MHIGAREFTAAAQLRRTAFEGFSLLYGERERRQDADFAIRGDGVAGFASGDFPL